MYKELKIKPPFFEVGPKAFLYGERMLKLAKGADVVIRRYVNRETDKYNCQGTTSSTSLAVILHVLQTALIEETDYKNEQFALIHPGCAVGERLNK